MEFFGRGGGVKVKDFLEGVVCSFFLLHKIKKYCEEPELAFMLQTHPAKHKALNKIL